MHQLSGDATRYYSKLSSLTDWHRDTLVTELLPRPNLRNHYTTSGSGMSVGVSGVDGERDKGRQYQSDAITC
jgi:hypothetical protein